MRSVVRLYPGPPAFDISDLRFEISEVCRRGSFEFGAGWSSPVARWAHNPKVAGSNPAPATKTAEVRDQKSEASPLARLF